MLKSFLKMQKISDIVYSPDFVQLTDWGMYDTISDIGQYMIKMHCEVLMNWSESFDFLPGE